MLGLQRNLCFVKQKKLENDFFGLACWLIKKVAYCLEEPDFAKKPALKWMKENNDAAYKKMEDDFFLPFLYERLRDEFGQIVTKKPEKFGGNVDILFGDIPAELKVRKGCKQALIDIIVDEKYRPTSQAATYAANTRLGCVVVLDLPTDSPEITNLAGCVQLTTRSFLEFDLPTSIVVFILHCNLPRPSGAR